MTIADDPLRRSTDRPSSVLADSLNKSMSRPEPTTTGVVDADAALLVPTFGPSCCDPPWSTLTCTAGAKRYDLQWREPHCVRLVHRWHNSEFIIGASAGCGRTPLVVFTIAHCLDNLFSSLLSLEKHCFEEQHFLFTLYIRTNELNPN